jgi:hypothetical protein
MVEDLAPATPYPPLRNAILPGRLNAGAFRLQAGGFQEVRDLVVEFGVAVQNDVAIWIGFRKSFPQLLDNPLGGWMPRYVTVQDPAPAVLDHEEAIQQLERNGWYGQEVESGNRFAVVLEERQPVLGWVAAAMDSPQVARHASFGYSETELLKLAVDSRGSPARILFRHEPDRVTNLASYSGPPALASGSPPPIEAKTGAMPADYGFGLHDDEHLGPAGPDLPQCGPEQTVHRIEERARPFPFENRDLLPEGEDFEGAVPAALKEDADRGKK